MHLLLCELAVSTAPMPVHILYTPAGLLQNEDMYQVPEMLSTLGSRLWTLWRPYLKDVWLLRVLFLSLVLTCMCLGSGPVPL